MESEEDSFYDAEEFDGDEDDGWKASTHAGATPAPLADTTPSADAEVSSQAAAPRQLDEPQEPYPLHRAAWYGQVDLVRRMAASCSKEDLRALDSQGNTAMHVAVMRRQREVVDALLAAGCPAGTRNSRGWVPLMEAVELADRELALRVARAEVEQMRNTVKTKKASVLALLRSDLPDFSLQLKWELNSSMPGVGALVRRYAPHDTYTLWKKGGRIRVDGSLMGVDEDSSSLVPGFKRGHFSLLYDASGEKPRAVFVNHSNKTFIDVKAARKKMMSTNDSTAVVLENEVDVLMSSEVLQYKKLRSVDFRFKPVSGWLTKEVREKVEGWNCKVYEAAGRLIALSRYKMPYGLTPDMSFDDYLAATFEPDPVVESPVNPMNPASLKDRGSNPAKAAAKLAVAAKHQRIAAALAASQNQDAARVATAAAARAAAGGLRALAPRLDEEDTGVDDLAMAFGAEEDTTGGGGGGGEDGTDGDGGDAGSMGNLSAAERAGRNGGGVGRTGTASPRGVRGLVGRRDTAGSAATGGGGKGAGGTVSRRESTASGVGGGRSAVAAAPAGGGVSRRESAAGGGVNQNSGGATTTIVGGKPTPGRRESGSGGPSKGLPRLVFASAEPGVAPSYESTDGGDGGADGSVATPQGPMTLPLDVDLTALAAKVAAEAAEAEAARAGTRGGDDDDEEAGGEGGAAGGGKGARAQNGTGSPLRCRPGEVSGGGGKAGLGNGQSAGAGGSGSKSWKGLSGWGFSKKTSGSEQQLKPQASGGEADGGDVSGAAASGAGAPSGGAKGGATYGSSGAAAAAAKRSKKITGRCWMAESFPLSLTQLVPLLEVVGTANKAFARVARFMRKYGDLAMFPVKVHVPLVLTIYMVLSFKQFRLMTSSPPRTLAAGAGAASGSGQQQPPIPPPDDSFFEVPPDYIEATLENRDPMGVEKKGAGGTGGGGGGRRGGRKGDGSECTSRELSLLHRDVIDDEMGVGGSNLVLDD